MDRVEFDRFADEYHAIHASNISASGEEPAYFADYKVRDLLDVYSKSQAAVRAPAILDFGAGVGSSVPFLRRYLANGRITCLDVSPKSLEVGRARFGSDVGFVLFDGGDLPFRGETFDICFAACVFHHIEHREHVRLLSELFRVLKLGGVMLIYEHNPYNPVTRHVVNNCPFDENAHLIVPSRMKRNFLAAAFSNPFVRYRVFFPSLLRGLRPLESSLAWLPLGAQYYVAAYK